MPVIFGRKDLMKVLLLAYFAPPLLCPESMLLRRVCQATAPLGVEWHVVTVLPWSSYGKKDFSYSFSLKSLENPPHVYRTLSLEYVHAPLERLFFRREPFPDSRAAWLPGARKIVDALLKRHRFDVMISRAQPYTSHLLGLWVKECYPKLPWISYFSDPWGDNPYVPVPSPRVLEKEAQVLKNSSRVVVVSELMKNSLVARYPREAEKIGVIPHLYDPTWLDAVSQGGGALDCRKPRSPMVLTYAGNFYGKRSPEVLFRVLEERKDVLRGRLTVRFVGKMSSFLAERGKTLYPLVEVLGPRNYEEVNRLLRESQSLLLMDAPLEKSVFLPSKLVDYLALGKPLVAITPRQGAAWHALEKLPQANLFDNADTKSLGDFLEDFALGRRILQSGEPPEEYMPSRVGKLWMKTIQRALGNRKDLKEES